MLANKVELGQVMKGKMVVIRFERAGLPVRADGLVGRLVVDKRTGERLIETHMYGAGGQFMGTELYPKDKSVDVGQDLNPPNHLPISRILNIRPFRFF